MADTGWDTDDGLTIVLTPLQLAAILDEDHITPHEMMVNRLWATGGLLLSGLQLAGAGAMLAAPEPTMLTKVGGVALGVHGLDQGQAAARQLWTGQVTEDFTQLAGEAAARQFGADRKTAFWAGVGLDVAVPLIVSGGLASSVPQRHPRRPHLPRRRRTRRRPHDCQARCQRRSFLASTTI